MKAHQLSLDQVLNGNWLLAKLPFFLKGTSKVLPLDVANALLKVVSCTWLYSSFRGVKGLKVN